jgi:hypothetical protein
MSEIPCIAEQNTPLKSPLGQSIHHEIEQEMCMFGAQPLNILC